MKKIKIMTDKLNNNSGVSLLEIIITCLIVVIISAMIITGTQIGLKVYTNISLESEGQVLCSTLTAAIKDSLRYIDDGEIILDEMVDEDGNLIDDPRYKRYQLNEFFALTKELDDGEGGYLLVNNRPILSSSAYPHGLLVKDITVTVDVDNIFRVDIQIASRSGGVIAENTFEVKPLNADVRYAINRIKN